MLDTNHRVTIASGAAQAPDALPPSRLELRIAEKKAPYDDASAVLEASRCLYCADAPCTKACPSDIDVPTFIHKIATRNTVGAARTILSENLLGASCARVCPTEVLCAGACVYNHWGRPAIEIGRLQRYATEQALARQPDLLTKTRQPKTGKRIACVGAGPASLAAAGHLALEGHTVHIFEQQPRAGGLNIAGIAPYKLHAEDALDEVRFVLSLGDIHLRTGTQVVTGTAGAGEISTATLERDYDAVFLGLGLGTDTHLDIEGEQGEGVVGATTLILRIKLDAALSLAGIARAVVVGGGNTAIDVARELAQLGVKEVVIAYRRTAAVMRGYRHEMAAARLEGVRLLEERPPLAVVRDTQGKVSGLRVNVAGTSREETLPADLIVVAIGQNRLTQLAAAFAGVELERDGRVRIDEPTCRTGNAKVYAGGDCVNGGKEVVNAVQHGKLAARAITASFAQRHDKDRAHG